MTVFLDLQGMDPNIAKISGSALTGTIKGFSLKKFDKGNDIYEVFDKAIKDAIYGEIELTDDEYSKLIDSICSAENAIAIYKDEDEEIVKHFTKIIFTNIETAVYNNYLKDFAPLYAPTKVQEITDKIIENLYSNVINNEELSQKLATFATKQTTDKILKNVQELLDNQKKMSGDTDEIKDLLKSFKNNNNLEKYQNYINRLNELMYKDVPYDNFSLNDIYIQLFGYFKKFSEDELKSYPRSFGSYNIVHTEEWIINWIKDKDDYNILLLSGKPASGKTTLMKKLAHILCKNGYFTILIPLKSFIIENSVKRSVEQYCIEEIGVNPFESDIPNNEIVLLFDGLDEIEGDCETRYRGRVKKGKSCKRRTKQKKGDSKASPNEYEKGNQAATKDLTERNNSRRCNLSARSTENN